MTTTTQPLSGVSSFAEQLYHLAVGDCCTATFIRLDGMPDGHEYGLQFSTALGTFPIHQWSAYFAGPLLSRVQTFFCKLREHQFIELPLTHTTKEPPVQHCAKRRKKIQTRYKIFYHQHFQPGRVDWLSRVALPACVDASTHKGKLDHSTVVCTLQKRVRALERLCDVAQQRELYCVGAMKKKDETIMHLRQRLLLYERHRYDITDENGNAVAGENDLEITASCVPANEIQTSLTPTSVAADNLQQHSCAASDRDFDELLEDLLGMAPKNPPDTNCV